MNNNDRLIRLRYALEIKNSEMVEIFKLGGMDFSKEEIIKILTKVNEDSTEKEQMECTNDMLDCFLNGFIIYERGVQEPKPGQTAKPVPTLDDENVNNILLKKLRIALSLTSDDMLDIMHDANTRITKSELGAVLRTEGHRNYKPCGDRYVRNFLKGLALSYRRN